jgi:hypothetical protein
MKSVLFIIALGLSMTACSSNQVRNQNYSDRNSPESMTLCSDSTTVLLSASDRVQMASNESNRGYDLSMTPDGVSLKVVPKVKQAADPREPNLVEVKLHSGQVVWLLEKTCGTDLTEDRDS